MYISEIFGPTIQGEGRRAGRPSLFIRFAKCNLQCRGFNVKYTIDSKKYFGCDSFYAVDKNFKNQWKKLDYKQIINNIYNLSDQKNIDIVITGGEPLLYWENKDFQKLLKYLIKNNHFITIETNGTINISLQKKYQRKIMFSIGVKLQNSDEKYTKRINIPLLQKLLKQTTNSYLKFSIRGKNKELKEIKDIVNNLDITNNQIYLMPISSNKKELEINSKQVIQQAIKNNFLYSDRIHIRIWNNKRKV